MKFISHRGNIVEQNKHKENHPDYINEAYRLGYDVEVDVWCENNKFILGHDVPQYEVGWKFLTNGSFWCHAKNIEALYAMRNSGIHCFWHQEDDVTLTSSGYIWTHSNNNIYTNKSIVCHMDKVESMEEYENVAGICSDYIGQIK